MATSHSYTQFLGTEKVVSDKTVCDGSDVWGQKASGNVKAHVAGIAINLGE